MPKVSIGQYAEKDKKFSRIIKGHMEFEGINADKMALKASTSYNTHYSRLRNPENMTIRELRIYIQTLKIPEEDVLDALYLDRRGKG